MRQRGSQKYNLGNFEPRLSLQAAEMCRGGSRSRGMRPCQKYLATQKTHRPKNFNLLRKHFDQTSAPAMVVYHKLAIWGWRMFKSRLPATIALLGMLGVSLSSSAHADDFFFSFSNVTGNVPGTVSGEIFGLTNNATSAATDIVVQSFPAGLSGAVPTAPFSVPTWIASMGGTVFANSFTVTNDQITAASYDAQDANPNMGVFALNAGDVVNVLAGGGSFGCATPGPTVCVQNQSGFAGATYTFAPAPGPIPGAGLLSYLALGLLGLGSLGWKRFRQRPA
jgi:hypothetical protein